MTDKQRRNALDVHASTCKQCSVLCDGGVVYCIKAHAEVDRLYANSRPMPKSRSNRLTLSLSGGDVDRLIESLKTYRRFIASPTEADAVLDLFIRLERKMKAT